jgi:hypothetical protein
MVLGVRRPHSAYEVTLPLNEPAIVYPPDPPTDRVRHDARFALMLAGAGVVALTLGLLGSGIPRHTNEYDRGYRLGRQSAAAEDEENYRLYDSGQQSALKGRGAAWIRFLAMTAELRSFCSWTAQRERGTYIVDVKVIRDTMTDASYPPGLRSPYPGLVDIKHCEYMEPGREYTVEADGIWSRAR